MRKKFYPKAFLLLGVFPLTAYAVVTFIYIIVGGILDYLNVLPLNVELMMNYHVLTICLPFGAVLGMFYWSRSKITINEDVIKLRTNLTQVKRTSVKIKDIKEICAHTIEQDDSTAKFHIHLKDENLKIIEFWYDSTAIIELAKDIKKRNPNIKVNTKLQQIMS